MTIQITQPYSYTAQGMKPNQEDALFPLQGQASANTRVFMVCDGMGGHEHGEVASACVAETIGKATSAHPLCSTAEMIEVFNSALEETYRNLDNLDNSDSERRMGTTLTFLAICTDGVLVAHIGDSRIYQFRRGEGVVFQTRDHSLVNDLIAAGELAPEDARTYPQRNVITRAIQPHQEYPAKATFKVITDIRKGDIFFLCCDGVLEKIDDDELCRILLSDKTAEERVAMIEDECGKRETRDNNTCYLLEIDHVEKDEAVKIPDADSEDASSYGCDGEDMSAPKHSYRLWIIASIMVIIAVMGFIFLRGGSEQNNSSKPESPKKERVHHVIKRDRK